MKGATGLLIGVGAYLAYGAWAAANAVKQLRATVGTVAYNKSKSSVLSSTLVVKIIISNPTRETLSFQQFNGVVSLNGQSVANLQYPGPQDKVPVTKLTPGDTSLQMEVELKHLQLGAQVVTILKALFGNKKPALAAGVTGNVYVQGVMIPVDYKAVDLTSISGVLGRRVFRGLIPSYTATDASGRRFASDAYTHQNPLV